MKTLFLFVSILLIKHSYSQTTYTFVGNGNWTIASNWINNLIPPTNLTSGNTIYISPVVGGSCILDIADTISQGANFIVTTGSDFVIPGSLFINRNITSIPSVTICNQTWMLNNLNVDHYRNGDTIPQVTDSTTWANLTIGAWCYYMNSPDSGAIYGKLYNWYAVKDPRGLAPTGWHVPSDAEWKKLTDTCLGGTSVAGGKMKTTGTIEAATGLWHSPNTGATDSSGFAGLPGGHRFYDGTSFNIIGYGGIWWSSTEYHISNYAFYTALYNNRNPVDWTIANKTYGFSVRCVGD